LIKVCQIKNEYPNKKDKRKRDKVAGRGLAETVFAETEKKRQEQRRVKNGDISQQDNGYL
jgi:hypothetical protein